MNVWCLPETNLDNYLSDNYSNKNIALCKNEEDIQNAINRYFEKYPVKIVTDETLSIAGAAADAAAVRKLCIMHDDEVILFGGKSTD